MQIAIQEIQSPITELLEEYECDIARYSGRGMFGKECLGIICNNTHSTFGRVIQLLMVSSDNDELIEEMIGCVRSDSFGKRSILYFPTIGIKD